MMKTRGVESAAKTRTEAIGLFKRTAQVRLKMQAMEFMTPRGLAQLLSGLQREIQYALGESFVSQSTLDCRLGKLVVSIEVRIRVCF
jgi:hypothetical protein